MICIPVVASTMEEALSEMERCFSLADVVELRVDHMMDPDLGTLMRNKKGKILVTNRSGAEGGKFVGGERERIEMLKEAVRLGADYVDVELSTDVSLAEEVIAEVKGSHGRTKLIISHHDLGGTPSVRELRARLSRCWMLHAEIAKIVTKANSFQDNLRTLGLLPYARSRGRAVIAFCMGEMGRPGRVLAALLGSYMTFASLEKGRESAPGQLTVAEMRKILRILHPRGSEAGSRW